MTLNGLTLALKEWRRRPLRTLVTVGGVAIAIGAFSTVLAFERGYRSAMKVEMERLGAHVLVVPKGCPYDAASLALHGANWPCYLKSDYLKEIRAVPGVAAAVPALMTATYDVTNALTVFVGTDPELQRLKTGWRISGRFPGQAREILVGAEVARRLGWRLTNEVALPGLPGERGIVVGILAPTQGADDFFIYLTLSDAQRLFRHERELTHVLVRLTDPNRLDEVVAQLRGCNAGMNLNVVPLTHLFRSIQRLVNSTHWFLDSITLIAILVAISGVSNALLMAITERTREIGVLRALGASAGNIFWLIHLESIICGLAGGGLGLLAAGAFAGLVDAWLRTRLPFAPSGSLVEWDGVTIVAGLLSAMALSIIATLVPAWRACRLSPKEAMARPLGAA